MKQTLKWIAGVLLILAGFGALAKFAIISSLLYIVAGVICLPPTLKIIEGKSGKIFESWQKYLAVIIGIVIGGMAHPDFKSQPLNYSISSNANNKTSSSDAQTVEYKKIGDQIEVGNFIYRVDGVKFRKQLGNNFINETADGVFLIVPISLQNISKESRTIDGSMFKLKDEQGAEYESSSRATTALQMSGEKTLFLKQCQPNIPTSGLLVFEVPSKGIYDLQLSGGFWSGKTAAVKLTE
jgi:hypothetical protein